MKKKLFSINLVVLICITSAWVYAQAPLIWSADNFLHAYPQNSFTSQQPQKIETAFDGSVFVAGSFVFDGLYAHKLCIIKRNAAGDSLASFIDDDAQAESAINNYVNDMLIDFNNNIYVLGATSDSVHIGSLNYKGTSVLYKFNSSLTLLWKRIVSDADMFSMIFDASGNICLNGTTKNNGDGSGTNINTIKINKNGIQLWSALYSSGPGFDDAGADIASDASGNIYVCGNSVVAGNGRVLHTIKYNAAGQQQWVSSYNTFSTTGTKDMAQSIAVSASGNVYVSGLVLIGQYQSTYRNTIIKYNTSGIEQWHKLPSNMTDTYHGYKPVKIRLDINENVYVVSIHSPFYGSQYSNSDKSVHVRRYSPAGNLTWSVVRDTSDAYDFDVTPFGSIYIAGSTGLSPKSSALKLSSTGAQIWLDIYAPVIIPNQTGLLGFGACVNINPYNSLEATFGFMEQPVQPAQPGPGNIISNQWTVRQYNSFMLKDGSAQNNNGISDQLTLSVSPNPATDAIYLESTSGLSNATVTIYDIKGQVVKNIFSLEDKKKIDISDLKSGDYFIELLSENSRVVKRFIKE
jgi:hypothetical protein